VTTIQVTDLPALRRWLRSTQSAHRDRAATAGNIYFAVLFIAVVGGMLHKQLAVVFWPAAPNASELAGAGLTLISVGILFLTMRRLGPLGLTRPAASWLLTAPVSRRGLLTPALRIAAVAAAIGGALLGVATVGHVAARPMPDVVGALLPAAGALLGVLILLAALAAQAGRGWWPAAADNLAGLLVAAGVAGLVVDSAVDAPMAATTWPAGAVSVAVAVLAVVVVGLLGVAVSRLAATPNERILESSKTAGTLLDSAFGMEPSFVTEMIARQYWAGRRLRSLRLWGRVPVLVAQDLLLVRRRPRRLAWIAVAAGVPALLSHRPAWLVAVVLLLGAMIAGGVSTANVRTDAGNPVMLRMLGIDSRQALTQRLWVPTVLAAAWSVVALTVLRALGELPAGPWWALGLTLGPIGAVAAIRKARVGFVRNELLAFDTQMGVSISPGPLLNAAIGPDLLVLGLPTLVQIAQHRPLTWTTVLVQAVAAALGARGYLGATTSPGRVELTR
jgi:hypothetical protein